MRFFPLLLLFCLTCVGQPGPIALRSIDAWASRAFSDPAGTTNLLYWFVASDAVNTNALDKWTDRIKGTNLIASSSQRPIHTNQSYVTFTGSQLISNAIPENLIMSDGITIAWVGRGFFTNTINYLACSSNGNESLPHGFVYRDSTHIEWQGSTGLETWDLVDGYAPHLNDVIVVGTSLLWTAYTNGVQSLATATDAQNTWNHFIGIGNNRDLTLSRGLWGEVYEFFLYSKNLNSASISNLHYYATNTYSFTP